MQTCKLMEKHHTNSDLKNNSVGQLYFAEQNSKIIRYQQKIEKHLTVSERSS